MSLVVQSRAVNATAAGSSGLQVALEFLLFAHF